MFDKLTAILATLTIVALSTAYAAPKGKNIAKEATVTASTTQAKWEGEGPAKSVVDGDMTTRWSSQFDDDSVKPEDKNSDRDNKQHVILDFSEAKEMKTVVVHWETAAAKDYTVEVSDDQETWKTVGEKKEGAEGPRSDEIALKEAKGRYLKLSFTSRATKYGYSIYEVEVYK
jgi:hypothetical protein